VGPSQGRKGENKKEKRERTGSEEATHCARHSFDIHTLCAFAARQLVLCPIMDVVFAAGCLVLAIGASVRARFYGADDDSDRDADESSPHFYILRSRGYCFFKQISMVVVSMFMLVSLFFDSRDSGARGGGGGAGSAGSSHNGSHGRVLTSYYASTVIIVLSILLVVFQDGVNNLSYPKKKWMFLVPNAGIFVYVLGEFVVQASTLSLACVILYTLAITCQLLELIIPHKLRQTHKPSAESTCGLFTFLSFRYLNDLLIEKGKTQESITNADVPTLADKDSSQQIWDTIKPWIYEAYGEGNNSAQRLQAAGAPSKGRQGSLWGIMYRLIRTDFLIQACFQLLGSTSLYMAPLALQRIVLHVSSDNSSLDENTASVLPISVEMAVILLFSLPLCKAIFDNQNYMRGRHIGVISRSAFISIIYDKAFRIDLTESKEGLGKINNLISVDVGILMDFFAYAHFLWATVYEMVSRRSYMYICVYIYIYMCEYYCDEIPVGQPAF
jgi:hypothetical protein